MKKLLIALMLLCSVSAYAAAPVVTCAPSTSSGVAPLAVFLDCTATTYAETTNPYRDLHYKHNFGDSSGETWAYGAKAGTSKNYATGPLAAHVFKTAGTYTITSVVTGCKYNGGQTACTEQPSTKVTNTITVTNPDTVFSTNTICIAANSTPARNVGGCPDLAGITVQNATSAYGSADFDQALTAALGTNGCGTGVPCRRVLFKAGEAGWLASTSTQVGLAATIRIGTYGTGGNSTVTPTSAAIGGGNIVLSITSGSTDLAISNLSFEGFSTSDTNYAFSTGVGNNYITLVGVTTNSMGKGFVIQGGVGEYITGLVVQDSVFTNGVSLGESMYGRAHSSAWLGSKFGPAPLGQQTFRIQNGQKLVVTNNWMAGAGVDDSPDAKQTVDFRADNHVTNADDFFQLYFADNKVTSGNNNTYCFSMSYQGASGGNARVYDILAERNYFKTNNGNAGCIVTAGLRNTWRNNIIDITLGSSHQCLQLVSTTGDLEDMSDNQLTNNTCYSGDAAGNYYMNTIGNDNATHTFTGLVLKNNLGYAPNEGAPNVILLTGSNPIGTGAITTLESAGGNSNKDAAGSPSNGLLVNPLFGVTPPVAMVDYRPSTSSYAASGGKFVFPVYDFFHCFDNTGANRIGAAVPRAYAQCTGVGN